MFKRSRRVGEETMIDARVSTKETLIPHLGTSRESLHSVMPSWEARLLQAQAGFYHATDMRSLD